MQRCNLAIGYLNDVTEGEQKDSRRRQTHLSLSYGGTTMEKTILLALLCTTIESLVVKKHHFISKEMDWYNAQAYCRQHYTDLSFTERQKDVEDLRTAAGGEYVMGWIGLNRDVDNKTGWRWSGGGYLTYTNWKSDQPDNAGGNQTSVAQNEYGKWFDTISYYPRPLYCVHLTMEKEVKKSWEEALQHCRENHVDLISLPSETEILYTQRLMQQVSTDQVWVGLRYLGDRWLWLSGDPVENQAWSTGADQDHQCPLLNRCGALSKEGLWEARDCQEELNFICD